jgi:chemotaxis protein CheX
MSDLETMRRLVIIFRTVGRTVDHLSGLAPLLPPIGLRVLEVSFSDVETAPLDQALAVIVVDEGGDGSLEALVGIRRRSGGRTLPVFAVSSEVAQERYGRLLTAGATLAVEPDVGMERLTAELQALTQINDEGGSTLRNQLLQPYVAAALEAWLLMCRSQATLANVRSKREYRMYGDVSSLVYLMGAGERILALSLRNDVAAKLAVRVLNGVVDDPGQDIIQDVVGEMVNIIAGQVKGRYDDTPYHFDISTVTVVTGSPHHLMHRADLPCYEMRFDSDVGDFALQLCVRPPEREPTSA